MSNKDFIINAATPAEVNFAVVVDPDTKSGNPNHNAFTGQFGSGGKGKGGVINTTPKGSAPTADQLEIDRKYDQIRIAARNLEGVDITAVKNHLDKVTKRPLSEAEVNEFYALVRRQIISDLVTVYDQQKRGNAFGLNPDESWKGVRLNSLSPPEKENFMARMMGLGWSKDKLDDIFDK